MNAYQHAISLQKKEACKWNKSIYRYVGFEWLLGNTEISDFSNSDKIRSICIDVHQLWGIQQGCIGTGDAAWLPAVDADVWGAVSVGRWEGSCVPGGNAHEASQACAFGTRRVVWVDIVFSDGQSIREDFFYCKRPFFCGLQRGQCYSPYIYILVFHIGFPVISSIPVGTRRYSITNK